MDDRQPDVLSARTGYENYLAGNLIVGDPNWEAVLPLHY
jgi:hypothetical protein